MVGDRGVIRVAVLTFALAERVCPAEFFKFLNTYRLLLHLLFGLVEPVAFELLNCHFNYLQLFLVN